MLNDAAASVELKKEANAAMEISISNRKRVISA
jgi:hypothetical protein